MPLWSGDDRARLAGLPPRRPSLPTTRRRRETSEHVTRGETTTQAMTPEQEAFLIRARARLRELEALREEAHVALTSDEHAEVDRELLQRLDDVHAAITRALRGQQ